MNRIYHMARKINEVGGVSALCFKSPRAINLAISCWTIHPWAVTCPKCAKLLRERVLPTPTDSTDTEDEAVDLDEPEGFGNG